MCQLTLLVCSCCGAGVHDAPHENVSHGKEPYPHDTGFGLCRDCGGDPSADNFWERRGWASRAFYQTRFGLIRDAMNRDERAQFDAFPAEQKMALINRLVSKGLIA